MTARRQILYDIRMILIEKAPEAAALGPSLERLFSLAGEKVALIDREYDDAHGSPASR